MDSEDSANVVGKKTINSTEDRDYSPLTTPNSISIHEMRSAASEVTTPSKGCGLLHHDTPRTPPSFKKVLADLDTLPDISTGLEMIKELMIESGSKQKAPVPLDKVRKALVGWFLDPIANDKRSIFSDQAGKYQLEHGLLEEFVTLKLYASIIDELRADVKEGKLAPTPQTRKIVHLGVNLVEELGQGFDEVKIVVAKISKNIKQLMADVGCPSGLKELKNVIVSLRDKQPELVVICKNLWDVEHSVGALTLNTLFDLFST